MHLNCSCGLISASLPLLTQSKIELYPAALKTLTLTKTLPQTARRDRSFTTYKFYPEPVSHFAQFPTVEFKPPVSVSVRAGSDESSRRKRGRFVLRPRSFFPITEHSPRLYPCPPCLSRAIHRQVTAGCGGWPLEIRALKGKALLLLPCSPLRVGQAFFVCRAPSSTGHYFVSCSRLPLLPVCFRRSSPSSPFSSSNIQSIPIGPAQFSIRLCQVVLWLSALLLPIFSLPFYSTRLVQDHSWRSEALPRN
ncbi:hypothetical protein B0T26DRAFT_180330 [Lasiosphaeria miniovina]|uniref:Uncharacterized protein n=1 Tax=Lasiosphaeria miniovina TaxID=1954250 RepID=A0AA40E580_9PEZI|nr:uncharacterized protein B0T26DRAFT_180330 [Lasiosphaeria miniovina]KAK0728644.1 hypothetical protein B0T26DRAFT_180330 [Lasiosphaeria miniovina]